MSVKERKAMVSKEEKLNVRRQCDLLGLCRASLYYTPSEETAENLEIMRLLDRQYAVTPFYGQRRLQAWLEGEGYLVNIKRLRRLMGLVRWRTLFPQRRTTVPDKKAYKYPYLLKDLDIDHRNQVWEIDISYIPMRRGYMYLFAIIDVYTRYVAGWGLSNTMTTKWCVSVLEEAIERHGCPEIINSDQGSQFTSVEYVGLLVKNKIAISMDSRGRALDDVFIERLWRSVKQEYVYLNPCETGSELWRGLDGYFRFYNNERFHQSLDYTTPASRYLMKMEAA
jgi:putative transposase